MKAELFWISDVPSGRLAVMPRPRGGDWLADELRSLRQAGVDVLVSLLTTEEIAQFELKDEPRSCRVEQIEFLSFPIADRSVPQSANQTLDIVRLLASRMREQKSRGHSLPPGNRPLGAAGCMRARGARRRSSRGFRAHRRRPRLPCTRDGRATRMGKQLRRAILRRRLVEVAAQRCTFHRISLVKGVDP